MIIIKCNKCGKELRDKEEFGTVSVITRTDFNKDSAKVHPNISKIKGMHFCPECTKGICNAIIEYIAGDSQSTNNYLAKVVPQESEKGVFAESFSTSKEVKSTAEPTKGIGIQQAKPTVETPEKVMAEKTPVATPKVKGLPSKALPVEKILTILNTYKRRSQIKWTADRAGVSPITATKVIKLCVPAMEQALEELSHNSRYFGIDIPQIASFHELNWKLKDIEFEVRDELKPYIREICDYIDSCLLSAMYAKKPKGITEEV